VAAGGHVRPLLPAASSLLARSHARSTPSPPPRPCRPSLQLPPRCWWTLARTAMKEPLLPWRLRSPVPLPVEASMPSQVGAARVSACTLHHTPGCDASGVSKPHAPFKDVLPPPPAVATAEAAASSPAAAANVIAAALSQAVAIGGEQAFAAAQAQAFVVAQNSNNVQVCLQQCSTLPGRTRPCWRQQLPGST